MAEDWLGSKSPSKDAVEYNEKFRRVNEELLPALGAL
jgi:hypothetical protein